MGSAFLKENVLSITEDARGNVGEGRSGLFQGLVFRVVNTGLAARAAFLRRAAAGRIDYDPV